MGLFNLFNRQEGPTIRRVSSKKDLPTGVDIGISPSCEGLTDAESIMKIYEHLRTSTEIMIFINGYYIYYVANTKKFGFVRGKFDQFLHDFTFEIISGGIIYNISYVLGKTNSSYRKELASFTEWLMSNFFEYFEEYAKEIEL